MRTDQLALQQPTYVHKVRTYPAKVKKGAEKYVVPEYTLKYNQDSIVVPLSDPSMLRSNYGASYYSTYQDGCGRYGNPATGLGVINASNIHDSQYNKHGSTYASTSSKPSASLLTKDMKAPPNADTSANTSAAESVFNSSPTQPVPIKVAQGSFAGSADDITTRTTATSRQVTANDYVGDSPYAPRSSSVEDLNAEVSPHRNVVVPKSFVHPGHGESTYLIDYIPPARGGIADTIVYSRKVNPTAWTNSDRVDGGTGGRNTSSEYSQNYIAVRIDGKDYLAQLTPFDGTSSHLRNNLPLLELAEDNAHATVVPEVAPELESPFKTPKTPRAQKERAKTPKKERAKTPKGCSSKTVRK